MYFPKKPAHLYVSDENIREAFQKNPFIKKISEETDVFVRYWNANNSYYILKMDLVDRKEKKTKLLMSYITKFYDDEKPDISELDFISSIKAPTNIKQNSKGSLSKKLMRIKRNYREENDKYSFGIISLKHQIKAIWDKKESMPEVFKSLIKYTKMFFNQHIDNNKEFMTEIEKV